MHYGKIPPKATAGSRVVRTALGTPSSSWPVSRSKSARPICNAVAASNAGPISVATSISSTSNSTSLNSAHAITRGALTPAPSTARTTTRPSEQNIRWAASPSCNAASSSFNFEALSALISRLSTPELLQAINLIHAPARALPHRHQALGSLPRRYVREQSPAHRQKRGLNEPNNASEQRVGPVLHVGSDSRIIAQGGDGCVTADDDGFRPEILIGLVGALGTEMNRVEDALANALTSVGYSSRSVRVSELISSAYEELGLPEIPQAPTDLDHLMDIGDRLREAQDDGAAAAAIAVSAISGQRYDELGPEAVERGLERNAVATVIRQLKHPDEVDLLRSVYGSRFVLLGAWSPREQRQVMITQRLRRSTSNKGDSWYEQNAIRLMSRDESDGSRKLGQRVRDTFEQADAYVAIRSGYSIAGDVQRLVRLLFGAPFETPTRDEQAMFQAFGSRLRSSAGGRQVGAVAVDGDGELLVSGTNDVPKAGGGQYWSGDEPDHRDFQSGVDFNDQEKFQVALDLVDRLKQAGWLGEQLAESEPKDLTQRALLPGGPFSKSRLADLLEFGRILHAEMALICTAARRGTALRGATLYSTTYPCHACARLIIGSGIGQVVYIDPYPKSLVPRMYQTEVSEVEDLGDKVAFTAFAGVAPRLFPRVFAIVGRERDAATGEYLAWTAHEAMPRLVDAAVLRYPIQTGEDEVIRGLAERYQEQS